MNTNTEKPASSGGLNPATDKVKQNGGHQSAITPLPRDEHVTLYIHEEADNLKRDITFQMPSTNDLYSIPPVVLDQFKSVILDVLSSSLRRFLEGPEVQEVIRTLAASALATKSRI